MVDRTNRPTLVMSCIFDGLQIIVIVAGIVWSYGALEWAQRDGYRRVDRLRRKCRTRILNGELWESRWSAEWSTRSAFQP